MEEKRPDAVEVAAQAHEEGEAQEKGHVGVERQISDSRLQKYFRITEEALAMAEAHLIDTEQARTVLEMARLYVKDAQHFEKQGQKVTAFAALNYAHGWLDAGARLGLFAVKDSRLFTVDD